MPLFSEIISEIERVFPKRLQESYDNSGIQVFSGFEEITGVLLTLDVTEEVVYEAINLNCNLIIAHHPIIFGHGMMKITPENPVSRIIMLAIKNSISIYCAHTNADNMPNGTTFFMFSKLGISNYEVLQKNLSENFPCGSGGIGELELEEDSYEFLKRVKNAFDCKVIRHTRIVKPKVKKIAVCSGSGSFLLKDAISCGADVFLSADFTYHKFFEADGKILVADLGHFETETGIKNVFKFILEKKFTNFAVNLSSINTNPIKYL
ncbi:MAG: Nif3-like dinuclear metal center hexameric protein [Bacteroidales bacterium]|nr:Nif3-like dinuclear metal center hexameric protein [Bacteroidales bacterium]